MKRAISLLATTALLAPVPLAASAQSAGDWQLGLGLGYVDPKSNNGTVAGSTLKVDSDTRPTFTVEYFITGELAAELLLATPYKHTASLDGVGDVATIRHLPPTLGLNYYFKNASNTTPFVGLGINYTRFFDEEATGALAGSSISLKNSWGLAAHLGVDVATSASNAIRIDLRWIDIDSDVTVNGVGVGTANIDPIVAGISYLWRF